MHKKPVIKIKDEKDIRLDIEGVFEANSLDIVLDKNTERIVITDLITLIQEIKENWEETELEEAKEESYDEGHTDGIDETLEDEDALEKHIINYALSHFGEITTIDQFKEKFLELERRSWNFA